MNIERAKTLLVINHEIEELENITQLLKESEVKERVNSDGLQRRNDEILILKSSR
jgi:ABC-type transport system involved in cytochrome bd biosynthesis fused ATPase/permease subunit